MFTLSGETFPRRSSGEVTQALRPRGRRRDGVKDGVPRTSRLSFRIKGAPVQRRDGPVGLTASSRDGAALY